MLAAAYEEEATMTGISALPPHLQPRLMAELRPGEMLTWVGQPRPGRFMRKGFLLWFFFVPWTAFGVYWMGGASGFRMPEFKGGWDFFPLFGLPFILIGIGGLVSPFWLLRKARSIIYALTNERAITIEGSRSITVISYRPADIIRIERIEHRDGSGDLILISETYKDSEGDQQIRKRGFMAIDDVRKVAQLVEAMTA
jgi:hypothetical protein